LNKKKQRSTHHKEGNDSVNRNEGRRGRLQKKSDGSESESGECIYFTGNLENRKSNLGTDRKRIPNLPFQK
jgi:hypothetical protein